MTDKEAMAEWLVRQREKGVMCLAVHKAIGGRPGAEEFDNRPSYVRAKPFIGPIEELVDEIYGSTKEASVVFALASAEAPGDRIVFDPHPVFGDVPKGFRDMYWCGRMNEPFILEWRGRKSICVNCEGEPLEDTDSHTFIAHVNKPSGRSES